MAYMQTIQFCDLFPQILLTNVVYPQHVQRLRFEQYRCECEWRGCGWTMGDYDLFQRHVGNHIEDVQIVDGKDTLILLDIIYYML